MPGGATVVYDVAMVSFEREKESWDLKSDEEKLAFVEAKKSEGNALVAEGKWARALKRYARGLKTIEYDSGMGDDAKKRSKALKARTDPPTAPFSSQPLAVVTPRLTGLRRARGR